MENPDALGMARKLRFLAGKYRELKPFAFNGADWPLFHRWQDITQKLSFLLERLARVNALPDAILQNVRFGDNSYGALFYSPAMAAIGYRWMTTETTHGGGGCFFELPVLAPGPIGQVWPEIFNSIEIEEAQHCERSEIEEKCRDSVLWYLFEILGYYETACDLLADWIENHADDDQGDQVGDRDSVGSAALGAVVAGGLAGVLQAAVGARAVDRVTAIIRERVAADGWLYWRRADDWVAELQVSKPTVTDSVGWREVMEWRAANRADRVSRKTGRVSKKTGK